jgi:hypothetical protein
MSNLDTLPDGWAMEFLKGAAENALLRQQKEWSAFDRAVYSLRQLRSSEERARALYEAEISDRVEVCEQNEAAARAAGFPNLISMQHEMAEEQAAHSSQDDSSYNGGPLPF